MTASPAIPDMEMTDAPRHDPAALAAANINPQTGLATDYLNHFNEAIMLLDMIPDMPDCADDFLQWEPLSYPEHFRQSSFKGRDLAIAAYETATPAIREKFDSATEALTSILLAIRDAMQDVQRDDIRSKLATQGTLWLKPLVMQAGQIINGGDIAPGGKPQVDIDLLMSA